MLKLSITDVSHIALPRANANSTPKLEADGPAFSGKGGWEKTSIGAL